MASSEYEKNLQEIARHCLARKVRQASRVICAAYDEVLRDSGLKVSQFNLLVAIGVMGEASPAELGLALSLEKSTVSRNAERLLARGWLSRAAGTGRGVRYTVSRKGKALVQRITPRWREAQERARERLGPEAVRALERLGEVVTPSFGP